MLHAAFLTHRKFYPWRLFMLVCLLATLPGTGILFGQEPYVIPDPDEPTYEAPDPNTQYQGDYNPDLFPRACPTPQVVSLAVVRYETFFLAHLTFANLNGKPLTLNVQGQEGKPTAVSPVENQLLLNTLAPNTLYEIRGYNGCNEPILLTTINTYPHNPGGGIEVSGDLFRALADYTQVPRQALPLQNYLQNLNGVALYERIEFAQRFFLNGKALPNNSVGTFPSARIQQEIDGFIQGNEKCLCEFTINRSAFAIPDMVDNNLWVDEMVYPGAGGDMDKNGRWWFYQTDEGPAKNYELYSDGVNNGSAYLGQDKYFGIQSSKESKSPNLAMHGYHLICIGFPGAVPANCACSRTLRVNMGYDAQVEASANIVRSRPGAKKSGALAQEYAVAFTLREEFNQYDMNIVDAGLVTAAAKCEGGVPTMAIVDGAVLVLSIVAGVSEGLKKPIQLSSNQINTIRNQINSYIDKYFKEYDCTSGSNKQTLIQNNLVLTFEANKPLYIGLVSGSALSVRGKRSWKSHAKVKSSFHLGSVVLGGYQGTEPSFCCSDYSAQWALASQLNDAPSLFNKVQNFINLNIPFTLPRTVNDAPVPPNTLPIQTELGKVIGDFQGCQEGEIPTQAAPR